MLKPLFAALFCALIFTAPVNAGQSPRDFLRSAKSDLGEVREHTGPKRKIARKASTKIAGSVKDQARVGKTVEIAKRHLGTNPTGWKRLWCAKWLNMIEQKAGRKGTGSNLAKSFASYGRKVSLSQARPGDIGVVGRKGGGHVFYVLEVKGRKIVAISGNSGGRGPGRRVVSIGSYDASRLIALRRPA